MKVKLIWRIIYIIYPPILRVLEKLGFHKGRQDFKLGFLNKQYSVNDLANFLLANGYSKAILAWQDTGEVLNMRLLDKEIYQYHLRLFSDGELRGHYEFAPENYPLKHVRAELFENRGEYFGKFLGDCLVKN